MYQVKPPFGPDSTGDCILRTRDGTVFKVVRSVLSLASPVFGDMFGLPGDQDQIPTIDVQEDPETMETLLELLYPQEPPNIASYDLAVKLIAACDKYFIDVMRLRYFLYNILASPGAPEKDPLSVYAICWRLRLEQETKTASRYTHHIDITQPTVKADLIRRAGSINALLALWDLRLRREMQLENAIRRIGLRRNISCEQHAYGIRNADPLKDVLTPLYDKTKAAMRKILDKPFPVPEEFKHIPQNPQTYSHDCTNCHTEGWTRWMEEAASAMNDFPQTIAG